jgi:hypothetical protein
MGVVKSLWASVQGDARIAMIPISFSFGWLNSVTYVSTLSLWALVSGHWSTWQAARVEVTQDEQAREREEHPIEDRVVEKLAAEHRSRTSAWMSRTGSDAVESGATTTRSRSSKPGPHGIFGVVSVQDGPRRHIGRFG